MRRGWWVRALTRRASDITVDVNEIFVGDLVEPRTLEGALDRVDTLFSAAGAAPRFVSGQSSTFAQLDDQANRLLLNMALEGRVKRFGYVAGYGGRVLGTLEYIRAQESFVAALRSTKMDGLVVRTTPVFGGFDDLLRRARKGKVRYIGDGYAEVNPVHQADLAVACADALDAGESDIEVGGPEVLNRREIAELALTAWGRERTARHLSLAAAMLWGRLAFLRGKHNRQWSQYHSATSVTTLVAPEYGTCTLADYFAQRVVQLQAEVDAQPHMPWWRRYLR